MTTPATPAKRHALYGVGTYMLRGEACYGAVRAALAAGCRHIDTAIVYRNEGEVARAVKDSGIERTELFITTKLPPISQKTEDTVRTALMESLARLETTYVDCFMMHWPATGKLRPEDSGNIDMRKVSYAAMLKLKAEGLCREVGVSNFLPRHFESLAPLPPPDVHQLELNPLCRQRDVVALCVERGIRLEAYSPLGGHDNAAHLRGHPAICAAVKAAALDGVDDVAALLLWSVAQGFVPLPRSSQPPRCTEHATVMARYSALVHPLCEVDGLSAGDADLRQRLRSLAADVDAVAPEGKDIHCCWFSELVA